MDITPNKIREAARIAEIFKGRLCTDFKKWYKKMRERKI
jgi:hypothetical protein